MIVKCLREFVFRAHNICLGKFSYDKRKELAASQLLSDE